MNDTKEPLRSLATVRVSRDSLQDVIESNRKKHAMEFEETYLGWKIQVREQLEDDLDDLYTDYRSTLKALKKGLTEAKKRLTRVKDGDFTTDACFFRHIKPSHHVKDYNGALKKLELSLDAELELNSHEFNQFVMDEWLWKKDFTSSHTVMSGTYGESIYNVPMNGTYMLTTTNHEGSEFYATGSVANAVLNDTFHSVDF